MRKTTGMTMVAVLMILLFSACSVPKTQCCGASGVCGGMSSSNPTSTTPVFALGLVPAKIGGIASIPIVFKSNGQEVVTVSPLVLNWDASSLSFQTCVNATPNKGLHSGSPEPGLARIVLYGNLEPIADGILMHCQFNVLSTAVPATGVLVQFVSAGLSDASFNETEGVGVDGTVFIE